MCILIHSHVHAFSCDSKCPCIFGYRSCIIFMHFNVQRLCTYLMWICSLLLHLDAFRGKHQYIRTSFLLYKRSLKASIALLCFFPQIKILNSLHLLRETQFCKSACLNTCTKYYHILNKIMSHAPIFLSTTFSVSNALLCPLLPMLYDLVNTWHIRDVAPHKVQNLLFFVMIQRTILFLFFPFYQETNNRWHLYLIRMNSWY